MPYLINKQKQHIAYNKIKGKKPGIIFIHGLQSDMNGKKAIQVQKFARSHGHNFIRFDCRGHGKSYGKFENFCISDWKKDLLNIIDHLSTGPQILIGSSMGGWLMMLAARSRPKKIAGLIGIAAAPDFTKGLYKDLSLKNKKQIKKNGEVEIKSKEYSLKYIITKKLITDGQKNFVLKKKFRFNKPIILIHGIKDTVVSLKSPFKILKKCTGSNIQLKIIKKEGHRLSSNQAIKTILKSIEELLQY